MNQMKLVLGTMNFGPQVDDKTSLEMINKFVDIEQYEIDAAYVYNNGDTEKILGRVIPEVNSNLLSVATKVHPRITGKLDAHAVKIQFEDSLKRMKLDSVDILYFHFPDKQTSIESALAEFARLHNEGKVKELGLSNFPAWMVIEIWHICKNNNWPLPTVYQGMYNALARNVEVELFLALRKYNIRFYAFNPLAGGMLSGKHLTFDDIPTAGRFARLESYRKRYWKEKYFNALEDIRRVCQANNIPPAEAAYRWLVYHSFLDVDKGDGLIVGASRMDQLSSNIEYIKKGPLPEEILNVYNAAWEDVKIDSPPYFKFFDGKSK